jgi:hypothetical protein
MTVILRISVYSLGKRFPVAIARKGRIPR